MENMLEQMNNAFESEKYQKAIAIAEMIIEDFDDDVLVKVAKWKKARSLFLYALQLRDEDYSWHDDVIEKARKTLSDAYNQFTFYGNEYGWNDDVIYQQMLIDENWDDANRKYLFARNGAIFARNGAIILLGSDNSDYKLMAQRIYEDMTERVLHDFSMYQNRNWYNELDEESRNDQDSVEFEERLAEDKKFTNLQYEKRKYIFIGRDRNQIAGTYQLFDEKRLVNWIFTIDKLPPDIEFPLGRPQPGLYMAHPVKTEQYFPMKNAEETLFMEKVREFCWMVQCLGAREVSFHSIKGISVSEGYGSSMNVEASVGIKNVNIGGSYGNNSRHDESRGFHHQVESVQHFDPKKKAYCPDDLVWFDSDPAWKDLKKQRLNGNMLDYTYKISSSETCQMSSNEKDEVKANFEYMMMKANGSYNSEKDTTFNSSKETEWSIHVEFAPLDELTENKSFSNTTMRLSKNEQEYLDEVKDYLEDYHEIGPKQRKYLEKTRIRLGISESRAAEIEASVSQSQLTDEEKEYLDEVQEVREDYGEIGPKERKYLEKTRIRLGISVERANELERM